MTEMIDQNTNVTKRRLPDGWRWVRLGDVAELLPSKSVATDGDTEVKAITTACLTEHRFAPSGVKGARMWAEDASQCVVSRGEILIARSNTPELVGRVAMYSGEPRGAVATDLTIRIWPTADVMSEFLTAYLSFLYQTGYWKERAGGASGSMKKITRSQIGDEVIPLPPPAVQHRIAAVLNEQMAAVERARAAAEPRLEAAKGLLAAYLRATFDSQEIRRWPSEPLGNALQLRKEIVHPRDNPQGPATFVGLEHIESITGRRIGSIDLEKSALTGRKPRFYTRDIVYGYLRPYLNKVWIAEFDGLCSVDQYVYSVDRDKANTEFVAWFMRSPGYLRTAPIGTTPGQLPRIRTEEVSSVEIHLPPLTEQERVVRTLKAQVDAAERVRKAVAEELAAINTLPAALLRRVFSGAL